MKSGIFLVDKPLEISSNQLVQKIKHQFNLTKVGHAGTLDPLATGLMIILVNNGTKLSDLLLNETKQYLVTVKLYSATSTGDVEGEVIDSTPNLNLSEQTIKDVLKKYNNYTYQQIPPIYSAIKINGKKLYEYARAGQEVNLTPRTVTIIQSDFISYDQIKGEFSFQTTVSKGTYIRSLVVDLTADLQTFGHLTNLTRTASGSFNLENAKPWTNLTEQDLISSLEVVQQLPIEKYELSDEQLIKVNYGQPLNLDLQVDRVFLTYHQQLIALYGLSEPGIYKSIKNNLK